MFIKMILRALWRWKNLTESFISVHSKVPSIVPSMIVKYENPVSNLEKLSRKLLLDFYIINEAQDFVETRYIASNCIFNENPNCFIESLFFKKLHLFINIIDNNFS